MKIGIDLDEVIVDFIGGFLDFYNGKRGKNVKREDIKHYQLWKNDFFKWTREDAVKLVDEFNESESFGSLNLFEGAKETLQKLNEGNELFIITSRKENTREKTEKFLSEKIGDIFSEIIFTSEYDSLKKRN